MKKIIFFSKNLNIGGIGNDIINDMKNMLKKHNEYIVEKGEDLDEIKGWRF